jgi:hypothetical protein
MKVCRDCAALIQKLAGPIEEKSGPGAIIGKYRCPVCWKGYDVRENHPHNLNPNYAVLRLQNLGDAVALIAKVRAELGIVVPCDACKKDEDETMGRATKASIVFHNCGRSENRTAETLNRMIAEWCALGRDEPLRAIGEVLKYQRERIGELEKWGDADDEWSAEIKAAHPSRTGAHENYAIAMKMVGNRHSKHELVALVCWLLGKKAT